MEGIATDIGVRKHSGCGVENALLNQDREDAGRPASYLYQDPHCSLKAQAKISCSIALMNLEKHYVK